MEFKGRYPQVLLSIFLLFWLALAISPKYLGVWAIENFLSAIVITFLVVTYKKFKFSNLSYTLIFIFMILHTIGGHYSYSEMPLFDWLAQVFDLSRNHYDRVVHFLFGALLFIPAYEFISKRLKVKYFWGYFSAFLFIIASKSIFEVIEFLWVLVTRSDIIGTHYLGMQGDQWDAQKDILLGSLGAGVTWFILWVKQKRNSSTKRKNEVIH
ncbi:MAG: DUF2238 domain-containing protein [Nanoarchaeota archaeon]|nr:DUF2238 domain-containing protein [Nanoarchaeota archaeon]